MIYKSDISPLMQKVGDLLIDRFPGMDHCITDTRRNLIVEAPKGCCDAVRAFLKQHFPDVALIRNAYPLIDDLHDFILIKPMISEAPIYQEAGVFVPDLEKLLVDRDSDKEYASLTDTDIQREFQLAFERYPVNTSRLLRYASRKGKKEEISSRVARVNRDRVETVRTIQDFFRGEPVLRAWLFGSFSRMEERPDSDIDILVDIDRTAHIGLLEYAGMRVDLSERLGREVDLVENGALKPYAIDSVNRDKYLIYERT